MQCMLINSNTGVNVTHPSSFFNISGIFALIGSLSNDDGDGYEDVT